MARDNIIHELEDWSLVPENINFPKNIDLFDFEHSLGVHRYDGKLWTGGYVGVGRLYDVKGNVIQTKGKEHIAYSSFEGRGIGTKQSRCTAKKERCGEESYTIRGERMKIIQYRNAEDIDILFDNGYIATHKRYANFKSGRIAKGQMSADV